MDENFLDLLKSITQNYTFDYYYLNTEEKDFNVVKCKYLTMSDLNQIVEASLQDTSMQVGFYTVITKIFQKSLESQLSRPLNIIDRILYILQTRAVSVSPTKIFAYEDESVEVDFNQLIKNLKEKIIANIDYFIPQTFVNNDITITCDIPTIDSDILAGEQFYKYFTVNVNDEEDIKLFLGQNFMLELVKCVKSIAIKDSVVDFSLLSFEERIKIIEETPMITMQDVITYNKNFKNIINDCLTINDYVLPIDGSLFLQ